MKRMNNTIINSKNQNAATAAQADKKDFALAGATENPAMPGDPGTHREAPVFLSNGAALQVKDFEVCVNMADCVESMLFDSDTTIASISACTSDGHISVTVDLMVRGEVSVTYQGQAYRKPSQFPQELRERIRKFPGEWDCLDEEALANFDPGALDELAEMYDPNAEDEDDLYINCRNWFEYIYTVKDGQDSESDGICCEEDLAGMHNSALQKAMLAVAKEVADKHLEEI